MAFEYDGDFPVSIDILTRAFEASAIESRDGGGGKKFQYIAAETCIRRLNEATGNRWSFGLAPGSFVQFLDGGNDRNGNPENVLMAICELTIPGLGSRQGIGVQRIKMPVQNGEDMMKGVLSDALKKCATLFGVALELYGPELDIPAEEAQQTSRQIGPPSKPLTPPRAAAFSEPRHRQEPNGPEVQRLRIQHAAEAKDMILADDQTAAEWADALDSVFEALGRDFRVDRLADGTVTAKALFNAILALPAKATAEGR